MPAGKEKSTLGLSVWALDAKHPNTNKETSVITLTLVVTPAERENGSIKVQNKCTGNSKNIPLTDLAGSVGLSGKSTPKESISQTEPFALKAGRSQMRKIPY